VTKKTLIIYSSRYGQTEKIMRSLGETLKSHGQPVDLRSVDEPLPQVFFQYKAVVFASSIYRGQFNSTLIHWAERHRSQLEGIATYTVLVHLNAADQRPEARAAEQKMMTDFNQALGLKPLLSQHLAGALNYTRYNFLIRWLMRRISAKAGGPVDTSQDYELTDWIQVRKFAEQILQSKPFRSLHVGSVVSDHDKMSPFIL
jgi:menaquinone-dependent protoporphyrinogen oxidase